MPTFEEEVLNRLDGLTATVNAVRDDVLIIKAGNYGDRIDELDKTVGSHGERIAKTEVRSGFIGAIIAGLVSFFFHGNGAS